MQNERPATFVLKFLLNNQRKQVVCFFVLFFAFISLDVLNVMFFKAPKFNELIISDGKINITYAQSRVRGIYTLNINNTRIPFNCGIASAGNTPCVPIANISDYQGKTGKVWWYKTKNVSWLDDYTRLYQLEVNGKLVISYQEQVEIYQSIKRGHTYPYILFFIISIFMFVLLQFANDPKP